MRRLTKRKYGGIIPAAQQDIFCSNFCDQCSQGTGDCKELKEMLERLTQIEDILGDEYDLDQLKEMVEAKSADVAPVVHGKWENCDWVEPDYHGCGTIRTSNAGMKCTNCVHVFKKDLLWKDNYCPNCGAKMDLEG